MRRSAFAAGAPELPAKKIPAGVFKQECLAILDEVAKTHHEVVITKLASRWRASCR